MASGSRILSTREFKGGHEGYFFNIGQGQVAIKHLKIKGTRNYYFKTTGYCFRTKVKTLLS